MTRRALVLAVCLVAGCTNAGLQPPDESENNLVDDKLAISGEVCTSVPSEQVFPVKIMFIVDTSGSMQFTDPSSHPDVYPECIGECEAYNRGEYHLDKDGFPVPPAEPVDCPSLCEGADNPGRMAAVQEVIDRFKNNPAVSFSVITFNGVVMSLTL